VCGNILASQLDLLAGSPAGYLVYFDNPKKSSLVPYSWTDLVAHQHLIIIVVNHPIIIVSFQDCKSRTINLEGLTLKGVSIR
jgi:hypothetical protein